MVFFATFILPIYINSGIFTIPEFLERRFDVRSRYYFSAICIIGNVFLDAATALYAAALIIKLLVPSVDIQVIVIVFALQLPIPFREDYPRLLMPKLYKPAF